MKLQQGDKSNYTDSDRPVTGSTTDEYEFVRIAQQLAPAFLDAMEQDGIVVGLEGAWGSGKTSLLNLLLVEIARVGKERIEIVSLAPWASGDDESLVVTLLNRIAESLEAVPPSRGKPFQLMRYKWEKRKKNGLAEMIRLYGAKTSRAFTPALKIAGAVVPGFSVAADVAALGADALEKLGRAPTNAQLKAEISKRLASSMYRYLVVLDDLDRLEPAQSVEVIRLVRSVADFPNILYLMCYDRKVLARALERGIGVEDGNLFLRKIVQQTFSIPLPEPFDLRLNFGEHAIAYFESVHNRTITKQESESVWKAVSDWGRGLRTPRDVKLSLNGVRFHYLSVKDSVNFADVCRLQLIKTVEPGVYLWLEEYLGLMSVIFTGDGRVGKNERVRIGRVYAELFNDDANSPPSRLTLSEFVPGLGRILAEKPEDLVFGQFTAAQLKTFVDDRRIGSPFHYRYYFAMAPPRTALPQADWIRIVEAASSSSADVAAHMISMYRRKRAIGGNWLAQLFNRLDEYVSNDFTRIQIQNLMIGIADIMDDILLEEESGPSAQYGLARSGEYVVKNLTKSLLRFGEDARRETLVSLLACGGSVTWITGYLMRSEVHRHGIPTGLRKKPEADCLFLSVDIDAAIGLLLERISIYADDDAFRECPDLSSLLFGWRDLGSEAQVAARRWVGANMHEDSIYVDFLLRMRSWAMSDAVYFPLHRKTVECFIDTADLEFRLKLIAENSIEEGLRGDARVVLDALELAKDLM